MARTQFNFDDTDDIRKQLAELLGQFERLTSEPATLVQIGLAHTSRIENAKLNSLVRDRAALSVKAGEGDERLAQLDERIAAQRQVGATIESLNARAAAGAPTIQRGGIVHGRVITPAGEAVPKVRVVAVDAKGKKQAEDVTDGAGRYELRIAIAAKPAPPKKTTTKSRAAKLAGAGAAAGTEPAPAVPSIEVRVQIVDGSGRVVQRGAQWIEVQMGTTIYHEVTFDPKRRTSKRGTRGS